MTTAKFLNFSKAAEELNIAQSAVSRQIKLLEESVNEQLIIRSSKKVLLTEKGEALLSELERLEDSVQEIFFGHMNKTIKVGILHGLLETWFNDIMAEFAKKSQHQLSVEVNTLDQLKEKLHNRKYDLIFTTENIQSDLASSLKLFEEHLVLVSKSEINSKEASNYTWICYSEEDPMFHAFKKRSNKIILVNSVTAMLNLVRKGVGVAIVPDHLIAEDKNLKRYEVKGLARQHIHLSTLNFKNMPDHIKVLVQLIKNR